MFRFTGFPWLSEVPDEKELKRLNTTQLLLLCGRHRGIKPILIKYLMTLKKL
jgi:hypothetical protein